MFPISHPGPPPLFENRRGEGPGDEVSGSVFQEAGSGWLAVSV